MKHYIGSTIVLAKEMTENEYNSQYSNNKECDYQEKDQNGYAVKYPDQYVKFLTKGTFEMMFREISSGELDLLEYGKSLKQE
jgi:hypothetical protein